MFLLLLSPIFPQHRANRTSNTTVKIQEPSMKIALRHREDFQAGNFSRFVPVWLILLGK